MKLLLVFLKHQPYPLYRAKFDGDLLISKGNFIFYSLWL